MRIVTLLILISFVSLAYSDDLYLEYTAYQVREDKEIPVISDLRPVTKYSFQNSSLCDPRFNIPPFTIEASLKIIKKSDELFQIIASIYIIEIKGFLHGHSFNLPLNKPVKTDIIHLKDDVRIRFDFHLYTKPELNRTHEPIDPRTAFPFLKEDKEQSLISHCLWNKNLSTENDLETLNLYLNAYSEMGDKDTAKEIAGAILKTWRSRSSSLQMSSADYWLLKSLAENGYHKLAKEMYQAVPFMYPRIKSEILVLICSSFTEQELDTEIKDLMERQSKYVNAYHCIGVPASWSVKSEFSLEYYRNHSLYSHVIADSALIYARTGRKNKAVETALSIRLDRLRINTLADIVPLLAKEDGIALARKVPENIVQTYNEKRKEIIDRDYSIHAAPEVLRKEDLERLDESFGRYTQTLARLSSWFIGINDNTNSEAFLKKALKLLELQKDNGENAGILTLIAEQYIKLGNSTAAKELLARAMKQAEATEPEYTTLKTLRILEVCYRMIEVGEVETARKVINKLELNLKEPEDQLFLLKGYIKTGQMKKAEALTEKALTDTKLLNTFGFLFSRDALTGTPVILAENGLYALAVRMAAVMYALGYYESDLRPLAGLEKTLINCKYKISEEELKLFRRNI